MGQALVHEQERSGAAWMLEWLTLPQMIRTTGSGLLLARRLLDSVERMGVDSLDDG
jgi:3-carboxy-cis,cis-muconate cycloisomerase